MKKVLVKRVVKETEKAYHLELDIIVGEHDRRTWKLWFPKSQIEIEGSDNGGGIIVTMPEWLFDSKIKELQDKIGDRVEIVEPTD